MVFMLKINTIVIIFLNKQLIVIKTYVPAEA